MIELTKYRFSNKKQNETLLDINIQIIWLRTKWRQTEHRPELQTHSDCFFCLSLELKLNHYFEVSAVFDLELNVSSLPSCEVSLATALESCHPPVPTSMACAVHGSCIAALRCSLFPCTTWDVILHYSQLLWRSMHGSVQDRPYPCPEQLCAVLHTAAEKAAEGKRWECSPDSQ